MFNVKQKEAFIDYIFTNEDNNKKESNKIEWVNLFNRLETIEVQLNKDFSYFDLSNIREFIPMILIRTINYQNQQISLLRKYINWCIENNCSLDKENRLVGINAVDLDFSRLYNELMVKDEHHLEMCLNKVFPIIEEQSADNMYRLLLHLVFNGFTYDEVWELKTRQVNYKNKTITFNKKPKSVSDKCCDLVKRISEIDFIITHSVKRRMIVKQGYILENSSSKRGSMKKTATVTLSEKMSRLKEILGHSVALTCSSIYRSGIFYRIWQHELETSNITSNEIEVTPSIKSEYLAWKKAFDL